MKILIVSDAWYPQINGVVRTYEHLSAALIEQGHDSHIVGPSDFPFRVPMPGYAEIELTLFSYRRLKKTIAICQPDHLHIATEGPLGLTAQKIAAEFGMPFTTAYHTQFPDYFAQRVRKFFPMLERVSRDYGIRRVRRFHNKAAGVFVATPSLERQLREWEFTAPLIRLTRGVDLERFRPGPKTRFQELKAPVALYVGRVAIEKSIEDFLTMEWDGSKVVIGHGPSLDSFKRDYPDIHFLGKKEGDELAEYYRSADLFVFPSRTDTFGMVLIEALASGLPVAAYPATGPVDIVTQDYLGALDENLSVAARRAMTQGTAQQRYDHVRAYYTWETAMEQFLQASPA